MPVPEGAQPKRSEQRERAMRSGFDAPLRGPVRSRRQSSPNKKPGFVEPSVAEPEHPRAEDQHNSPLSRGTGMDFRNRAGDKTELETQVPEDFTLVENEEAEVSDYEAPFSSLSRNGHQRSAFEIPIADLAQIRNTTDSLPAKRHPGKMTEPVPLEIEGPSFTEPFTLPQPLTPSAFQTNLAWERFIEAAHGKLGTPTKKQKPSMEALETEFEKEAEDENITAKSAERKATLFPEERTKAELDISLDLADKYLAWYAGRSETSSAQKGFSADPLVLIRNSTLSPTISEKLIADLGSDGLEQFVVDRIWAGMNGFFQIQTKADERRATRIKANLEAVKKRDEDLKKAKFTLHKNFHIPIEEVAK